MIKLIHEHKYFDEIYTVAKLFFPNESIVKGLEICQEGYVIKNILLDDDKVTETIVYKNGKIISTYKMTIKDNHPYLTLRRTIMLTVYHVLQIVVGADTPWGALTGIRPSKLVREWLDKGLCDEEIIKILKDTFCCKEEKAQLALTVAYAEKRITQRIYASATNNVIGIYVSIPFCPTRCIYCSFNAEHKPADYDLHKKYVLALADECMEKSKYVQEMGYVVSSIYIGGGTPTVLSPDLLEYVLETISKAFNKPIEYTVEAGRPDTITTEKLRLLKQYGVNRIAVNPQTLSNQTLTLIGRKHTVDDFFNAFYMARDVGFECINVDLIVGLPNETVDNIKYSIENVVTLSPENITIHTLAIKRASRLNEFLQEYPLPDAHTTESMLNIISKELSCEYAPYYLYRQKNMIGLFENIGYSKPSRECLYNVGMMAETQTILGIGAGAVSKFVKDCKITREFNVKNAEIYIERRKSK